MCELYIGNLNTNVTQSELEHHFRPFGRPLRMYVGHSRDGNKTFGFVRFAEIESAVRAIRALDKTPFKSEIIDVQPSNDSLHIEKIHQLLKEQAYAEDILKQKEKDKLIIKDTYRLLTVKSAVCKANEAVFADGIDLGNFLKSVSQYSVKRLNPRSSTISLDTQASLRKCLKSRSDKIKALVECENMKLIIQRNKVLLHMFSGQSMLHKSSNRINPVKNVQPEGVLNKTTDSRYPSPKEALLTPLQFSRLSVCTPPSDQLVSSEGADDIGLPPQMIVVADQPPKLVERPEPPVIAQLSIPKLLHKRSPTLRKTDKTPQQLTSPKPVESLPHSPESIDIPQLVPSHEHRPPLIIDDTELLLWTVDSPKVMESKLLPLHDNLTKRVEAHSVEINGAQTGSSEDNSVSVKQSVPNSLDMTEKIAPRPLTMEEAKLIGRLRLNGTPPPSLNDCAVLRSSESAGCSLFPAINDTEVLKKEDAITPPPLLNETESKVHTNTPPSRVIFTGPAHRPFGYSTHKDVMQRPFFNRYPSASQHSYPSSRDNRYRTGNYSPIRHCHPRQEYFQPRTPLLYEPASIGYRQPYQNQYQIRDRCYFPQLGYNPHQMRCPSWTNKDTAPNSALRIYSVNSSPVSDVTESSSPSESELSSPSTNPLLVGMGRGAKLLNVNCAENGAQNDRFKVFREKL